MAKFGARRYKLHFDDREPAFVNADTPAEAVSLRPGGRTSRLPHTITDLTAIATWLAGKASRGTPHMALLGRMRGEGWYE